MHGALRILQAAALSALFPDAVATLRGAPWPPWPLRR
jgi:hypothetical protein